MTLDSIADLPDHELRRRLLEHLDTRAAMPFNVRALRQMILDPDGLDVVRTALGDSETFEELRRAM